MQKVDYKHRGKCSKYRAQNEHRNRLQSYSIRKARSWTVPLCYDSNPFIFKKALLNISVLPMLQSDRSIEAFLVSSGRPFHKVGAMTEQSTCAATCRSYPLAGWHLQALLRREKLLLRSKASEEAPQVCWSKQAEEVGCTNTETRDRRKKVPWEMMFYL